MRTLKTVAAVVLAHAGGWTAVDTTAYSPCSSGSITASGALVRWGDVAQNTLPFRTRIQLWPPVLGRTVFTVMDRIGGGTSLDIYMPSCGAAITFGRRVERMRVLGR